MKLLKKILNINYRILITNYLVRLENYTTIKIDDEKLFFYTPNNLVKWRVKTFFTKEPDTLKWIDNFKEDEIFWDIGANIGLYSLYAAKKKVRVVSFEPSTNNTRILARNISKNNLHEKILLFPIALSNIDNKFLVMNESNLVEGSAHNSFGKNLDFEGKSFNPISKYSIFGTTIDKLINDNVLDMPDHIKIDVDGFEHLILMGAKDFLSKKKLKTILVEINENYKEQFSQILKILENNGFASISKNHLGEHYYNYIFKNNSVR